MVEELARWKAALTRKIADLQVSIKCLLDERNKVYSRSLKTCCALSEILESLNSSSDKENLKSANLIDITNLNENMSENLKLLLNIDKDDQFLRERLSALPKQTNAEKNALQVKVIKPIHIILIYAVRF